ncbi:FimB/Mfa2 family fimbrial subunit [uncultured Bacteroides sp.]|uniref:FimB/Mfa2 family fimbrial subunit n=1 Tax=uncultured Bacteroides sp. TaxID=162156 RepID=UPI0025EDB70E|nr:FimB/Mfa2 family fimbrial subunit [uncultured Bacteroides sp.]
MDIRPYVRKCRRLLTVSACMLALHACSSVIYDDEGDCSVNYRVRFRYDYNMKYADAFAHEVSTVTLYLLDKNGNVVWQRTEQGEALASEDYAMNVDVLPGEYDLLAWCGTSDKGSFTIPETSVGKKLTCTLNRQHDAGGGAFVEDDLDRLFHGWLPEQTFSDAEGTYTYIVPLVKNTNNVRVVLQHISGEAVDKDKFLFTIHDDNGSMDWDNKLLPDEPITYYAWHTDSGEADMNTQVQGTKAGNRSVFSAAIAELTIPRLVKGQGTQLTVTNKESGKTVFSIPLIDYALLVKGFYNRDMDDQEYLDRQDEYDMVFFLDEGDRWLNTYIYINSWKVVLQNTGL